jgi:hypothetical protein
MLARTFSFAGGFFVYVALLLCFVQVPPQINKPLLAGAFAAIGAICAIVALALRKFAGWRRTLGAILVGASLISAAAVGAITLLRSSTALGSAAPTAQLSAFTDYRTGAVVVVVSLFIGAILFWTSRNAPSRARSAKKRRG